MKSLAGTGTIIRLILRRDRVAFAIWVIGFGLFPLATAASFDELYPTAAALQAFTEQTMSNPTIRGMLGPVYAPTLGGLVAWRLGVAGSLVVGIPALVFITRHTRVEEESGRLELLGATVVGRQAPLTAALLVVYGMSLVIAFISTLGLVAFGLPFGGAAAFGLTMAGSGVITSSIGAVTAQVTESGGTARGIGLTVFAAFLAARIVGDASGISWITWASPLGWTQLIRPFADERWWVFALVAVFGVISVSAAYVLSARRDLGAGLIVPRPGSAFAAPGLSSSFALAWRLQRGSFIGWSVAFAVLGLFIGAVGQSISGIFDSTGMQTFLQGMGAEDSGEAFLLFMVYIMSQVVTAYVIVSVLKMRSEENEGRADPILATSVGRLRWAASHSVFAVAGPVVMLLLLGLAVGAVYGFTTGDVYQTTAQYVGTALVKLPAVWIMAGLVFALYGLIPSLSAYVSWAALILCALLEFGWELNLVNRTVFDISPFAHVHPVISDITLSTLALLMLVAVVLASLGAVGLKRRDLA